MDSLYTPLLVAALCALGLLAILSLVRALRGPDMADRVIAINRIGTMIISCIVLLSVLLKESFLLDIALLYAALNFIATVLLCRSYVGVFRARKKRKEEGGENA